MEPQAKEANPAACGRAAAGPDPPLSADWIDNLPTFKGLFLHASGVLAGRRGDRGAGLPDRVGHIDQMLGEIEAGRR